MIFKFYNPYNGNETKVFSFEDLKVRIDTGKLPWLSNPIAIYFLKNKMEVIKTTKWKDGFSLDTLNNLRQELESLTSPIL